MATLAAIERGRAGEVYNVCDDDPAAVRDRLPFLARAVGAPPPPRIPAWLARLVAGPAAVAMVTEGRGASNAKANAELEGSPAWPTCRDGFASASRAQTAGAIAPAPAPTPSPAPSPGINSQAAT
jgi:hypothetical protein